MAFELLADLVVVVHLAFVLFVAVGGLLVWRWPRLMWCHLPAVAWGIAIITIGFTCPLTPIEHYLRGRAGQQGHNGGFVDRYVEGVIYPAGLTPLVRGLIAAAVVVGYAGAVRSGLRPRTVPASSRRSVRAQGK
jgi:Protein of Unknown function (DUF2784)